MKVHSLWIYPVKSLSGIPVQEFELDDFGPVNDRRWMIVDDECHFLTQRTAPGLARISTRINNNRVEVTIPGEGTFTLSPTSETLRALVWRDWVQASVGEPDANDALSRYCGQSLRFVYMPETSFRRVDTARVQDLRRVSFADGFPLLITSLASLEELNERLDFPVEMRRFRPNVVVEGAEPWAEDHWRELTVGAVRLSLVKPCFRCVMTTVDPDTGIKHPATQPLKTLAGYRRTEGGVVFGMNAVHETSGHIALGHAVTVNNRE
jgi:uncharacterized protein YcbX